MKNKNRFNFRRVASALLAGAVLGGVGTAHALNLNLNYDPDATFTAAGLTAQNIVDMKAANAYAAAQFTSIFNDAINVNIRVTAIGGTTNLGGSTTFIPIIPFATLQTRAVADASSPDDTTATTAGGSIPAADIIGGAHNWRVSRAQGKALGFIADDLANDGTFTFGGGFNYTYDSNNRAVAGKIDFIGVAMHEFSEIMGRIGLMANTLGGATPNYMMFDLFHYTAAGTRGLNNGAGRYFSIDNGTTNLKAFNNASLPAGGDLSDWASGSNDAFNAFSGPGVLNALTAVDIRNMDVIGYNLTPVPEPATLSLFGLGALGLLLRRKK